MATQTCSCCGSTLPPAEIMGHTIQHDNSGVGHNWRNIAASDLPAKVREEIECEIEDGGNDECDDYRATNGLHYRWR